MSEETNWIEEFERASGIGVPEFCRDNGYEKSAVYKQFKRGWCTWPRFRKRKNIRHPLYATWNSMKGRCYQPSSPEWEIYGGRGIRVCTRWYLDFWNFVEDMGPRPSPSHSLDRKDSNGNYEPSNCQWATYQMQALNRRDRGSKKRPYVGVERSSGKWRARITLAGVLVNLGYYGTPEEAARAYNAAASTAYGAEAVLNDV